MILAVCPHGYEDKVDMSVSTLLYPEEFTSPEYQPFIASRAWERVDFYLTEIKRGYLEQVKDYLNINVVFIDGVEITPRLTAILTELYPEHAAAITKTFISKGDVKALVSSFGKTTSIES